MSRKIQTHFIDGLIQGILAISKSGCSLSDQDLKILKTTVVKLEILKKKKGKTNKEILLSVEAVVKLLWKFFINDQFGNE